MNSIFENYTQSIKNNRWNPTLLNIDFLFKLLCSPRWIYRRTLCCRSKNNCEKHFTCLSIFLSRENQTDKFYLTGHWMLASSIRTCRLKINHNARCALTSQEKIIHNYILSAWCTRLPVLSSSMCVGAEITGWNIARDVLPWVSNKKLSTIQTRWQWSSNRNY